MDIKLSDTGHLSQSSQELETFYRVLFKPEHLERWNQKLFYSFHGGPPAEWQKIWDQTKSTDERDYNLHCLISVFKETARAEFLRVAPKYSNSNGRWSQEDLLKTSELAGVCAYENPRAAYEYEPAPESLFAEFRGRRICKAPEKFSVVAEVVEVIGQPISRNAFKARHSL